MLLAKRQQHKRGKGRVNTKAIVNDGRNSEALAYQVRKRPTGEKPRDAGRTSAPTTSRVQNTNEEQRHTRSLSKSPFIQLTAA